VQPSIAADAPKALFFAPHPDDETIAGGLALRLLRQGKWNIINVAVTQGSLAERKSERFQELKNACAYLGFGLVQTAPTGLDKVRPATRTQEPALWEKMVNTISKILQEHRPRVIFFPHELDWNGTHIGVYWLVMDALRASRELKCYVVETEFWGQMQSPNLMVEYTAADVADLVAATSFHIGEVKRNPYHLLLPAWMQDNVRRGGELVGGQGKAAPNFLFAQLYRMRRWNGSQVEDCFTGGQFLPASENPAALFAERTIPEQRHQSF
jgi:LmbE family N-acetylglucosaminyl deacetylase